MKKKIWIRVLGVVAFLAWVWDYLVWHSAITTRPGLDQGYMGWVAIFFACVAGFITAVWVLFSIIDWALRRQAKLRGGALAQGLPGVAPRPWPVNAASHPAASQAAAWPTCAFCHAQPAAWVCSGHQWPACLTCANAHLQADPQCTYAPLQPAAPAPAAGPRAVVTSPLAGLR